MDPHVPPKVIMVLKGFLTHRARVRPCVSVSNHVHLQVARLSERFAADFAFEGLVACMVAHVLFQFRVCQESLIALLTAVRSLPGVNAMVANQSSSTDKFLIAVRASIVLPFLVIEVGF